MWNGFAGTPHQIYHLLNYRNHYSFIQESLKLSLKDMLYCFKWGLNAFFSLVINSHTWIFSAIQQVLVLLIILLIKQGNISLFFQHRNTFCRCPRGSFAANSQRMLAQTHIQEVNVEGKHEKGWSPLITKHGKTGCTSATNISFTPPSSFLTWRKLWNTCSGKQKVN